MSGSEQYYALVNPETRIGKGPSLLERVAGSTGAMLRSPFSAPSDHYLEERLEATGKGLEATADMLPGGANLAQMQAKGEIPFDLQTETKESKIVKALGMAGLGFLASGMNPVGLSLGALPFFFSDRGRRAGRDFVDPYSAKAGLATDKARIGDMQASLDKPLERGTIKVPYPNLLKLIPPSMWGGALLGGLMGGIVGGTPFGSMVGRLLGDPSVGKYALYGALLGPALSNFNVASLSSAWQAVLARTPPGRAGGGGGGTGGGGGGGVSIGARLGGAIGPVLDIGIYAAWHAGTVALLGLVTGYNIVVQGFGGISSTFTSHWKDMSGTHDVKGPDGNTIRVPDHPNIKQLVLKEPGFIYAARQRNRANQIAVRMDHIARKYQLAV